MTYLRQGHLFDSLASLGEPLQQDLQQPACFSMDEVSDRKGTDLLESRLLTRNRVTEENWNEGSHTLWFWFWFGSQFLDNLDLFSSSFLYPFLFLRSLCFWLITLPGLGQLMSSARCESIWNRQQLLLSFCTKVVFWSFCTAFVLLLWRSGIYSFPVNLTLLRAFLLVEFPMQVV